jgi:hypothetical protein
MRPLASSPLANGRIASGHDLQAVRVRKKLEEISANLPCRYGIHCSRLAGENSVHFH